MKTGGWGRIWLFHIAIYKRKAWNWNLYHGEFRKNKYCSEL